MNVVKNIHLPYKICIAVLAVVLLYPHLAESVPEIRARKNSFGIGPRVSYVQVRDDIVVPLRFSGPGISLLLSYKRHGAVHQHEVNGRLGLAYLRDRYGFSGAMLSSSVSYQYLYGRSDNSRGAKIFPGGQLRWSLNDEFFFDWDEEHLYWLTTIDLGPVLRYSRTIKNDRKFHATLYLPVVTAISRPPLYYYYKTDNLTQLGFWFNKPHEDLHFAFFDTYQAVELSLACEKGRMTLTYTGSFARAAEPEPVLLFTNSIDVTWRFQW